MGIFDELKNMGLNNVDNLNIYEEKKEAVKEDIVVEGHIKSKMSEKDMIETFLNEKKSRCPVCGHFIYNPQVKMRRVRRVKSDLDLRPIYNKIDALKYDIILCKHCGFSSPSRLNHKLTTTQINLIKNKITPYYKGKDYPQLLDYPTAIERYKLALYNAVILKAKDCEKAYICLKITWLFRGYKEESIAENVDKEAYEAILKEELAFMEKAYQGFVSALTNKEFPLLEIDEITAKFITAELARRLGKYKEGLKWLSEVLGSTSANRRLKDKAVTSKELIRKAQHNTEEQDH